MPQPQSDYFEGEFMELSWRHAYRPELVPLLMSYLGAQDGMSILEVGCGTGFLSRLLAKNLDDVHIIGLDSDEKLLAMAGEMVARDGVGKKVSLRKGDAYELPLADNSFDLVTSQTLL
ncbi:MAG: class I SAM-dependent methyltransferase [Candidatus Promineifilaceae bacterium]|nr:class I SAM-dependent methyltransferase [Candidatus Promineifilaceae bacterium]